MDTIKEDFSTFDMFKEYLKYEEEDISWHEEQLALIEKIGVQNWLVNRLFKNGNHGCFMWLKMKL